MTTTILSYENSPPISVPLPFYLVAALFGVAAGLLIALSPDAADGNRWYPAVLAATHFVTLGVLGHAMFGSILQLLPVVAGIAVPGGRPLAWSVLVGLSAGTLLLAAGFLAGRPVLLAAGGTVLGVVTLVFAGVVGWAASGSGATGSMRGVLRVAAGSLSVVASLGVGLVGVMAFGVNLPLMQVLHLHIAWGAIGWVFLLVIGVAFTVVPMFQVTPAFPAPVVKHWPQVVVAVVLVLSVSRLWFIDVAAWSDGLLALVVLAAAAVTLRVQSKSQRPADVTRRFWQVAMIAWALASIAWLVLPLIPFDALPTSAPSWWLGVLALVGGGVGAVNGMLYKIVPFLVWLHLKNRLPRRTPIPTMQQVIPERWQRAQMAGFFASVLLLLAMPLFPVVAQLAGIAFASQQAALLALLVHAVRRYFRTLASYPARPQDAAAR